ncbi:hypothetical protein [Neisseria musculi]|uniref:hypothetical protein n=1 Tax=Neisseria musculi TaxID=1815583 RepID=UPI00164C5E45|nr:hypothetical protein [Neisseria musculi]
MAVIPNAESIKHQTADSLQPSLTIPECAYTKDSVPFTSNTQNRNTEPPYKNGGSVFRDIKTFAELKKYHKRFIFHDSRAGGNPNKNIAVSVKTILHNIKHLDFSLRENGGIDNLIGAVLDN